MFRVRNKYSNTKIEFFSNSLIKSLLPAVFDQKWTFMREKRSRSGLLGKNMRQIGRIICTAARMLHKAPATLDPPRFAAGTKVVCNLAQFFRSVGGLRSGSSCGRLDNALQILSRFAPSNRSTLRRIISPSTRCPIFVRHPSVRRHIYLISRPLRSRATTKVHRG